MIFENFLMQSTNRIASEIVADENNPAANKQEPRDESTSHDPSELGNKPGAGNDQAMPWTSQHEVPNQKTTTRPPHSDATPKRHRRTSSNSSRLTDHCICLTCSLKKAESKRPHPLLDIIGRITCIKINLKINSHRSLAMMVMPIKMHFLP